MNSPSQFPNPGNRRRKRRKPKRESPSDQTSSQNEQSDNAPSHIQTTLIGELQSTQKQIHHKSRNNLPNPTKIIPKSVRKKAKKLSYIHTNKEISAGGLVVQGIEGRDFHNIKAVLIGRVDKRGRTLWSLPKGHIEDGETIPQTAIREICEETGIEGTIIESLGKFSYWFVFNNTKINKTVHHYLLNYNKGEISTEDPEVSEVKWIHFAELYKHLTYTDERKLVSRAEKIIKNIIQDPQYLQSNKFNQDRKPNTYEQAAARRNKNRTKYALPYNNVELS